MALKDRVLVDDIKDKGDDVGAPKNATEVLDKVSLAVVHQDQHVEAIMGEPRTDLGKRRQHDPRGGVIGHLCAGKHCGRFSRGFQESIDLLEGLDPLPQDKNVPVGE